MTTVQEKDQVIRLRNFIRRHPAQMWKIQFPASPGDVLRGGLCWRAVRIADGRTIVESELGYLIDEMQKLEATDDI